MVTDGVGLNITVLSYEDHLDFGIVGDRELAPDLDMIIDVLGKELKTLEKRAKAKAKAKKGSALFEPTSGTAKAVRSA